MKWILNRNRPKRDQAEIDDITLDAGIQMLRDEMDQRELAAKVNNEKITKHKFDVHVTEEEYLERRTELDEISNRMKVQGNYMYVLVPKNKARDAL